MDRISGLPQSIQHDIFNFLEEREIARAAVLSKAWRNIVQNRSVLVLFQPKHESTSWPIRSSEDLLFMNHVNKLVQNLVGQDLRIQKFSLRTNLHDTETWSHYLDLWIRQLVDAKVKVLSLDLNQVYVLPPFVFLSETITSLRLDSCDLGQCNCMRLPNLIELTLQCVTLSQGMINQISSGCPNLEILRLISCRGFSSICVSGLARLREVELSLGGLSDAKVVAPMLRVFKICSWGCNSNLDLLACESTLTNLTLSMVRNMTAEGLKCLLSKFLGLEELVLDQLRVLSIEIPNQKLLQLEVSNCSRLKRSVRIDAPNLRVLKYCRNNLPFDPVISSISPNCMIEVHAALMNKLADFRSYKDLVLKLRGLTNMKLILSDDNGALIVCQVLDENVIKLIDDDAETPMIQSIEMVHVTTHEQMADRLFDSCVVGYGRKLNTISIMSRDQQSNGIFLEALRKESLKEKKEEPKCCRYKSRKCWKCRLYDAEAIDEETVQWPPSLLHRNIVALGYKIARIKLRWNWMSKF